MRTILTIIGVFLSTFICSQKLDIEGDAKIQTTNDNTKDCILVTDGDRVNYYRDLSTIVTPGTTPGEMQYGNGTAWVTVVRGNADQFLRFFNGVPVWTPEVGPTDVLNPATGKVWMDRNLGASQVATSGTDASAYGDLYQWGRRPDGHEVRTSGTTNTLSRSDTPGHGDFILSNYSSPFDWRSPQNANLWQGVSGRNNPCPTEYRLPTELEWEAERSSWSSNNAAGAFASPLKLPMGGYRDDSNGSLDGVGKLGSYWSSTVSSTSSRDLDFDFSIADMTTFSRASGLSVRCLKN